MGVAFRGVADIPHSRDLVDGSCGLLGGKHGLLWERGRGGYGGRWGGNGGWLRGADAGLWSPDACRCGNGLWPGTPGICAGTAQGGNKKHDCAEDQWRLGPSAKLSRGHDGKNYHREQARDHHTNLVGSVLIGGHLNPLIVLYGQLDSPASLEAVNSERVRNCLRRA